MASTFSPNFGIEEPARGDYVNTWDLPVNANWTLLDQAVTGVGAINLGAGSVTLTKAQAAFLAQNVTGLLTANTTITLPAISGRWYFLNTTTGAFTVTVKANAGDAGVIVPNGTYVRVISNGTNSAFDQPGGALTVPGLLTAALGLTVSGAPATFGTAATFNAASTFNGITSLAGASSFANNTSAVFNGPINFKEQTLVITSNIAAWDMSQGPNAYVTAAAACTMALPTNIPATGYGKLQINNSAAAPIAIIWNGVFASRFGGLPSIIVPGTTYFEYEVKSGVVYVSFRPANAPVLLNTIVASNQANVQDTTSFLTGYRYYKIQIETLIPVTDNMNLFFQPQVSAAFQTVVQITGVSTYSSANNNAYFSANGVINYRGISNLATGGVYAEINVMNPAYTSGIKMVRGVSNYVYSGSINFFEANVFSGAYTGSSLAMTGFQLIMSSGNISSGTVKVYGWN